MRTSVRARHFRRFAPLGLLSLVFATDCSSDHSALAARPRAAGAGGKAGAGMGGGGGKAHGGAVSKGGTGGSALMPDKHDEKPGRSVFTVVHGVVDAERVAWCFARARDGVTELVGAPTPEGGLGYGESLSFEELAGIDGKKDGVVPFVITGDLALLDGLDCDEAVARAEGQRRAAVSALGDAGAGGVGGAGESAAGESGRGQAGESSTPPDAGSGGEAGAGTPAAPAPLRVGQLPGLPAGALAEGFSVLEVAVGCFGAPTFTDPRRLAICGADYTPATGSLSAELVILSRDTAPGMLALQALHASRGSENLGVRAAPPDDSLLSAVQLVDDFTEGALRPRDPRIDLPNTSYGADQRTWWVQATTNGSPVYSEPWWVVRKRSGVTRLDNGRGYTLIVIGPSGEIDYPGWWNPPAFALVDNDPGGQ